MNTIELPRGTLPTVSRSASVLDEHMAKQANAGTGAASPAVSEKSIAFARSIAERLRKEIPAAAFKGQRKLSAWIDANKEKGNRDRNFWGRSQR